jgi:hypothetical protein
MSTNNSNQASSQSDPAAQRNENDPRAENRPGPDVQMNARRNENNNIFNRLLQGGAILVALIAIFGYFSSDIPISSDIPKATCNMTIAGNRDFNRYYGLNNLKNHFTTPTADECDSNIIFKPALPQNILKADSSASSFVTLAKYGTGKTLLRCEY